MMKDSKRRRKEEGNYKTASKQLIRWHHLLTDNYLNVNGLNLNVNGIEWLTGLQITSKYMLFLRDSI